MFLTAALLLLALATAAAGLAVLGGRASQTLDVASHFAPIIAAANALTVLAAAVAGRGAAAALALAGLAAVLAAMAPELIASARRSRAARSVDDAGPASAVTIVQFNLWNCNRDPEASLDWLAQAAADVVVLEEVQDAMADAAQRLAAAYPHQAPGQKPGTRLLSRWPLLEAGELTTRVCRNMATGAWARIDHPDGPFVVAGFHAAWPIPPGLQQGHSAALAARVAAFDQESLIVCGDFNSTPWSGALRRQDRLLGLERRTRALFTWPVQPYTRLRLTSPVPLLPLDHVYAGPAWRTVRVTAGPRLGSDHLPVVAVLARAAAR